MPQHWLLHHQAQEYMVVIPTKYQVQHGWADCVDGFNWIVKLTEVRHIVCVEAIVEPLHLVRDSAISDGLDSI
jgi:hypothetical protein